MGGPVLAKLRQTVSRVQIGFKWDANRVYIGFKEGSYWVVPFWQGCGKTAQGSNRVQIPVKYGSNRA